MGWTVKYTKKAQRDLKKLDSQVALRIRRFLEEHVIALPNPRSISLRMKGFEADRVRYRVGAYRIIARVEDEQLIVVALRIRHRSVVYRDAGEITEN